jgi:hypothetical protein
VSCFSLLTNNYCFDKWQEIPAPTSLRNGIGRRYPNFVNGTKGPLWRINTPNKTVA